MTYDTPDEPEFSSDELRDLQEQEGDRKWEEKLEDQLEKMFTKELEMYGCTCQVCGKQFSSSVPGWKICPNCYV